jgi:mannosyltransferase OCH1-like enzyme
MSAPFQIFFTTKDAASDLHIYDEIKRLSKFDGLKASVIFDKDISEHLNKFHPELAFYFDRLNIYAARADIMRLVYLYDFGGLYVDAHGVCVCDLPKLFEQTKQFDFVLFKNKHIKDGNLSIMLSKPKCDFLKDAINIVLRNLQAQYKAEQDTEAYVPYNIYELTGIAATWPLITPESNIRSEQLKKYNVCELFVEDYFNLYANGFEATHGRNFETKHWSKLQTKHKLFTWPKFY